jgi:hypothetical protein
MTMKFILKLLFHILRLSSVVVVHVRAKKESATDATAACPCDMTDWAPPEIWRKAATARWMRYDGRSRQCGLVVSQLKCN